MNETIKTKLEMLPQSSGVYKMMDAQGSIIYIGKAVNLKNRVRQYFQSSKNQLPKVQAMVSHITDFEYILTSNETEALTLESNLIKQHMPRYNILLKDDKHFPYVKLDIKRNFPTFNIVRRVANDGAKYFGPYLSGIALRESMNVIRDYYPVRHCKKDIEKAIAKGERPCLMYHVGKCCAPCSGKITREQYHELLDEISAFLEGNTNQVISTLKKRMQEASENLDFERAATLRDRINAICDIGRKQQAISASTEERDVFAVAGHEGSTLVFALFVRNGKIVDTEKFEMQAQGETESEIMASFLKQYYADAGHIPQEITLRSIPEDLDSITEWLTSLRGRKVAIVCPQRGIKRRQVELAYKNGMDCLQKQQELENKQWTRHEGALALLAEIVGLSEIPQRLECYDNSHIQGRDTVGSMVVFINGKAEPKEYRRFKIKSDTGGDDYAAMREVLTRRLERAKSGSAGFIQLPDLLIVDGGRGQLNVALDVLKQQGYANIAAIGISEKNEELILPDAKENIILDRHSPVLQLVQRIRDEAHRFAIMYHRSLRARNSLYSVLDEIEGIGLKRRRALFDAFVTLEAIKGASIADIASVKGMNITAAKAVYEHFNK